MNEMQEKDIRERLGLLGFSKVDVQSFLESHENDSHKNIVELIEAFEQIKEIESSGSDVVENL